MNITFYEFSKRNNSTKIVDVSGTTLTCELKSSTSIYKPTLVIKAVPASWNPIWNYCYIPGFERYYFVHDWMWLNGVWECSLVCDVLASFKTDIGTSSEYILRTDSTTDFNTNVTDTMYPATTDVITETVWSQNPFVQSITDGCYIVGIISGGQPDAVGAITYYQMTSTQFGALKELLFTDDNLEVMDIINSSGTPLVSDLSPQVLKTLYNPYQYIASCMWFPIAENGILNKTGVSTIPIGWWDYSLSGYRLYAQTVTIGESVTGIPLTDHPQASTRGNYLNYAPYTRRALLGRFGTYVIDNSNYISGDKIQIQYIVDLITGQCRTEINRYRTIGQSATTDVLAQRDFLLGVPIQIAQVGVDYLGTAVSAINAANGTFNSAITGAMSFGVTGAIAGAISGAANGIYNTLQSAMPQVETSGTNGSFLNTGNATKIVEQFYKIVDEDVHHLGRPLCEVRQINTLTGYILCANGDLDLSCFEEEKAEIQRYLTTGFFYE